MIYRVRFPNEKVLEGQTSAAAARHRPMGLMWALPSGAAGLVQRVVRNAHVGDGPAAAMRCVLVAA